MAKGLKACRIRCGMTAQEAATKLGVSISSLFNWESGKRVPKADVLPDIAKLYGCTINELLGVED